MNKGERSHYYLVQTSSGWFAIFNEQTLATRIISKDLKKAKAALARKLKPEREKLPYRMSCIDELIAQEAIKLEQEKPKEKRTRPGRSKEKSRLADPAIQAALANVTASGNHYFRNGEPYYLPKILAQILSESFGVRSTKSVSRLIAAAWEAKILTGDRPIRRGTCANLLGAVDDHLSADRKRGLAAI
jgi:hypothetical protein